MVPKFPRTLKTKFEATFHQLMRRLFLKMLIR